MVSRSEILLVLLPPYVLAFLRDLLKALKEAAAAADKVSDSATKKVNSVTGDEATVQVLPISSAFINLYSARLISSKLTAVLRRRSTRRSQRSSELKSVSDK